MIGPGPLRIALNILVCLVSLLLVTTTLDTRLRSRDEMPDAKFEVYLERKDEIDVLFFGSSRIYRGIVPEIFDGELARLGRPLTSFNLGQRGMRPHETNELLRRVFDTEPARLRWIFVELADWLPVQHSPFTQRNVGWHDARETISALRTCWLQDAVLEQKLVDMRTHVQQFGSSLLSLGVASEALRGWLATDDSMASRPGEWAELYRLHQGFAPFSPEEYKSGPAGLHRSEFLRSGDAYRRHVKRLPELNAAEASTEFYNLTALRAQLESAEAAGVHLSHLIMPSFEAVPVLHRLAEHGEVGHLAAFDDPDRYSALYSARHRFDFRHLNQKGAERFSVLLARSFALQISPAADDD